MRSPSKKCLKCILIPYSITICVLRLLFIGIVSIFFAVHKDDRRFAPYKPTVTNFIVSGTILLVASFLACYGTLREKRCILITCAFLESVFGFIHFVWLIFFSIVQSEFIQQKNPDAAGIVNAICGLIGVAVTAEIIGVVLASLMASAIRAESHRIQTREAL